MSLVPYKEGSVILDDPSSRSLVIVHPSSGSLEFFQQVDGNDPMDMYTPKNNIERVKIASFVCPKCGTDISQSRDRGNAQDVDGNAMNVKNDISANQNCEKGVSLSRGYFKLLERNHRYYTLQDRRAEALPQYQQYFIPENLFIPGYFQKFFKTLSLLGNGARGSVYKVVHTIGDIELGVFALKKIPIGNDMVWFQKCMREVKALSSLTHKSANLITYNHVWLEMNTACGLVRTLDGKECDEVEEIPCIFILQQYCSGGNLEDFIIKDVFQKSQECESSDARKRKFRFRRSHPNISMGLTTLQVACIIRDIARGLQELHDIGLIHRDLKPSNCLLLEKNTNEFSVEDYLPTIVIGDLGECQLNGESRTASGATGTLEYTAPEIVITGTGRSRPVNYNEFTFASDIYSLGMICFFIIFGELPFQPQLEIVDLKQRIKTYNFDRNFVIERQAEIGLTPIDPEIFVLMDKLLSRNVEERPSAREVVKFLDTFISKRFEDFKSSSAVDINEDLEVLSDGSLSLAKKPVNDCEKECEDSGKENESLVIRNKEFLVMKSCHSKCISIHIYRIANLVFTILIATNTDNPYYGTYLALVLLGMSVTAPQRKQKWIIIPVGMLVTLALFNKLSRK